MDLNFDITQVIADPRAGIVPALLFFGYLLKSSPINNRYIPMILAVVGVTLGILFYYLTLGVVGAALVGLLYAASAIGIFSGVKNTFEQKNNDITGF